MKATIDGRLVDLEILDGKKTSQERELFIVTDTTYVRVAVESPAGVFTNWKVKFLTALNYIASLITSRYSVTGNGSAATPIQLVNDADTPGISKYYGTNAAGTKGWFTLTPGGGITTKVFITAADFTGDQLDNPAVTTLLIGKVEATAFILQTNNGSGTTVDLNDGINSFNSVTGIITVPADKYVLLIF